MSVSLIRVEADQFERHGLAERDAGLPDDKCAASPASRRFPWLRRILTALAIIIMAPLIALAG